MFCDEIKVQKKLVVMIADCMKLYYSWCESTSLYAYLLVIQNLLRVENTQNNRSQYLVGNLFALNLICL